MLLHCTVFFTVNRYNFQNDKNKTKVESDKTKIFNLKNPGDEVSGFEEYVFLHKCEPPIISVANS